MQDLVDFSTGCILKVLAMDMYTSMYSLDFFLCLPSVLAPTFVQHVSPSTDPVQTSHAPWSFFLCTQKQEEFVFDILGSNGQAVVCDLGTTRVHMR